MGVLINDNLGGLDHFAYFLPHKIKTQKLLGQFVITSRIKVMQTIWSRLYDPMYEAILMLYELNL